MPAGNFSKERGERAGWQGIRRGESPGMGKIKIFTSDNVGRFGFNTAEIEALNSEWEQKASRLGLEEHHPEYWQEARRHMDEKVGGRTPVTAGETEANEANSQEELADLPALEVDLDEDDLGQGGEEALFDDIEVGDIEEDFEVAGQEDDGSLTLAEISMDDLEEPELGAGQTPTRPRADLEPAVPAEEGRAGGEAVVAGEETEPPRQELPGPSAEMVMPASPPEPDREEPEVGGAEVAAIKTALTEEPLPETREGQGENESQEVEAPALGVVANEGVVAEAESSEVAEKPEGEQENLSIFARLLNRLKRIF